MRPHRPARPPVSSAARAACTRSRRRASRHRRSVRSSRTRGPRSRVPRSGARAPRRSDRGRGRRAGSRRRRAPASSGAARKAAKRFPSAASSTRSSCDTAAPEIGGIGGAESRSKHTARPYRAATRRSRSFSSFHHPTEARTSPRPGRSRTITPASASLATTSADSSAGTRHETSVARCSGHDDVASCIGQPRTEALRQFGCACVPPDRDRRDRSPQPGDGRRRCQVRVEARRAVLRHEASVVLVRLLGEVARPRDAERLGLGDDERARPLRPAEPLLPRDRVVVEPARVDGKDADRLRCVDEDRQAPSRP